MKNHKDKTIAILLAIFLSFWTWAYTWKKDKNKFVIGIILSSFGWLLLFIPIIVVWIWAIVDAVANSEKKDIYDWD